mmetsp:Transcript_68692/g.174486  ORF Transcript_68692/g.174486 Transcript_68692/m.174486 type:complete len:240 (+) Transcript_68692:766-1485(+)
MKEGLHSLAQGSNVLRDVTEHRPLILDGEVDLPVGHPRVEVLEVGHDLVEEICLVRVVDDVLEHTVAELQCRREGIVEVHQQSESQVRLLRGARLQDLAEARGALVDLVRLLKHQQHAEDQGEKALDLLDPLLSSGLRDGGEQVLAVVEEELEDRAIVVLSGVRQVCVNRLEPRREFQLGFLALLRKEDHLQPFRALHRGVRLAHYDVGGHLATSARPVSVAHTNKNKKGGPKTCAAQL